MLKTIWAFSRNDDGSVLEAIITHDYDTEIEDSRKIAIEEIQKEIQWIDKHKLFIIDGEKLYVESKLFIKD